MRKNTLLFGVLSLFGASQAMADDWVIGAHEKQRISS